MNVYNKLGQILTDRYSYAAYSMFRSIGIIGDSFASGEIYTTQLTDFYDVSWGQILGRMGGIPVVNYSKGGLTTKGWLENNTWGLGKLNSEAANDLYIIALGINDANVLGTAKLGTIADITSDSTDSFYSYYGRIVRAIRSHAPNAIIMLSTLARWNSLYDQFSDAVKAIGNYYSFAVMDLSKSDFFKSTFFSTNMLSNHPISVNYSAMAREYIALIDNALQENVQAYASYVPSTPYANPLIDPTLSVEGKAADAKETGDALTEQAGNISDLQQAVASITPGLSEDAKAALLNCFKHVAWIDDDGPTYYGALEDALYPYPKIEAVFTPGVQVFYTDDPLSKFKDYLVVTYYETAESAGEVLEDSDYTLTAILTEGVNIIAVSYDDLTTTFSADVVDFYNIWEQEWSSTPTNGLVKLNGSTDRDASSVTGVKLRLDSGSLVMNRRHICFERGKLPYTVYGTTDLSPYYPIPVPDGANKITVSITPNTQYSFINIVKYNPLTNKYENSVSGVNGWTQGVNAKTFAASQNLFAFINYKYDSAGTSYPTEPTKVTITFEEV